MEVAKLVVSILGFAGTISVLFFGIHQFRRSERWRRGEFVAKEVKEFTAQPQVHNVLLMIDWARRRINLAQSSELPERDWPLITRDVLWRALLPHTIKSIAAADSAADDGAMDGEGRVGEFTKLEVMLRDTFDTFLDGLERFASFVDSRLVTADEFRPYLAYWIDDLATDQGDSDDARWRCVLLTYIHFYRFDGVVRIFNALGHDVRLDGPIFQELRSRMKDDELYARLLQSATDGLYGASAIATSTPQWRLAQPANAIRR